jgi:TonB family protein
MATQPSDQAKQRPRSSPSDELAVIAQRAQAFTNASGAAIALSEGVEDEIVCRARSGSSAPDIGTSLRVEGTFTGLCIQSGKELRCDDAETDTRVDTGAIRALGIRSMVVTPIREDNRVIGVLAVFAPTPHTFTITHVAVLKTMADQIGTLLQKERRAREEGTLHPEPPVVMPKPVAAAPAVPSPAPVVIKPAASAAAAVAPARSTPAPAPKVEPIRPMPVAAEVAPPVPFPKKEEKRVEAKVEPRPEPRSEAVPKASFGTFDAVSDEQKKGGNKLVLIAIVAVVLIAAGVLGFKFLRKSPSASATQPGNQTAQNTAAATVPPPTTTQPSSLAAADNSAASQPPSTSPNATPASSGSTSANKPGADRTAADRTDRSDSKKTDQPRNTNSNSQPANNQPATQNRPAPTPATVALGSGPSRISVRDAQQPAQNTPDVAPSLAVGNGSSSASLSSLAKPTNTAAPSTVKQSVLVPLQVIRKATPVYPAFARARRESGTVVVRVTVGEDGKVSKVKFISGPIIFQDSAFDAARQSQYKPAMLNGQPIQQEIDVRMDFRP